MSELTPETRVWVAPDAYDNPTLWTDGPTPDFPRALLVRVSSNADLFDWIVAAEARVAELEAELAELKSRGCYPAVDYTASGGMVMDAEGRALTEKGAE